MATRMQQRRGTASQWTIADPVLAAGEIGVESDTAKFKIGDGINTWSTLDYFSATPDLTGYATETYVDDAVAGVLDSAPAALDTLNELAAALNDDANFAATVTTAIDAKQADVITTAGDLVVGDVNGDASRLAIGTDGQTLAVENGAITWKDSGSNNFVVEMSGSNNTVQLDSTKAAGTYNISLDSGDTTFDIYLIAPDGSEAGYSNSGSVTATADFDTVVALGVASDEVVAFSFAGAVSTADGVGDEPGAAAYLTSITPNDLPSIDDTATVVGGNFGANTEITFESGATVLPAKNIVVTNSTSLVVTRPDALVEDNAPYTLKAINTGVTPPTATNAHILAGAVTAGALPVWVTSPTLTLGTINQAYSETLEATDADGAVTYAVTAGSLPTGLSLNGTTGVISGTATAAGQIFTVTASDDGGNSNSREFTLPIALASGGSLTVDNGFIYHEFNSSGTLAVASPITDAEYVLVAGGGGGGKGESGNFPGGGGGAGGVLYGTATLSATNFSVTIGDGGAGNSSSAGFGSDGNDSILETIGTAIGGGGGGAPFDPGRSGGSGGGGGYEDPGGSGTPGQGNDGANGGSDFFSGGGGGSNAAAPTGGDLGDGGAGRLISGFNNFGENGRFGGGGAGRNSSQNSVGGSGGGADWAGDGNAGNNGLANTGGGGSGSVNANGGAGGSGVLIVRYAV